jgi:hypothetical protein
MFSTFLRFQHRPFEFVQKKRNWYSGETEPKATYQSNVVIYLWRKLARTSCRMISTSPLVQYVLQIVWMADLQDKRQRRYQTRRSTRLLLEPKYSITRDTHIEVCFQRFQWLLNVEIPLPSLSFCSWKISLFMNCGASLPGAVLLPRFSLVLSNT